MLRARQQKTKLTNKSEVNRTWFLFDAKGKNLGRLSAEIAKVLRGKHKPDFTSNIDTGDGVIVINAEHVEVTGAKEAQKVYRYHTGYMSGLREIPYSVMKDRKPEYIIERAVKGMMPKTRLGEAQYKHLRVYRGKDYKEAAQNPVAVNI
ncbi:MAG: 50S ribosomal protein L13 [Chlamydiia bacterium]|nr:50S ribosomal protein L13 [Chlamydiia bacterium]